MKKILGAVLVTAAITAQGQTIEDAQAMARCSAEFVMAGSLVGESNPNFGRMMREAQQSSAISRTFYQKVGRSAGQADTETKAWLGTLNRQFSKDPRYVKDYLGDQIPGCSRDNAKLQRFAQ